MKEHKRIGESYGPYFAAANSGKGFVSFYDEVFNRPTLKKRYIIKGGPGTGKSSLMRKVANDAMAQGKNVEHYRCSSDPDSLDGIIIDGAIALLDGTMPHSMDATLPGARDELINLGAFWDGDLLAKDYARIQVLNEKKQEAYQKAYRFLSACMEVEEVNRTLLQACIRSEKLKGAVKRLCERIPNESKFSVKPCLTDSVGMKGKIHFDSMEREAKQLYRIEESFGSASFYLAALAEEALRKQCGIKVSYDPVCPDRIRSLVFCQSGICFVAAQKGEKCSDGIRINMNRFVDKSAFAEVRFALRSNQKLKDALLGSAIDALQEAGHYHFDLEQIYVSCMDFDAESAFITDFCENILKKPL